jgi:peptidoglycan/LPS O-acetylase OafA/YrhL
VTAVVCALGVALAAPEWLPRNWAREDGPIEYAGFACFLGASVLAFVAAFQIRPAHRPALVAAALGAVLFVAAGEEISWGQRLLETDTPAVLVDGNRQDELNLHNIDGLQQKAIIGQLALAGAGVLLPWFVRRPWAWSGLPLFAGYLAYRAARGVAAMAKWGPAGRNTEAAELMLAVGVLGLTIALVVDVRRTRSGPHPPNPPSVCAAQPTG